jgi:ornithine cyclodeaminase/alanine dehydrogenase-like protein (mu-crystallin family)
VWNRTHERALYMVKNKSNAVAVENLEAGVKSADIITCATMSKQPIINGEWLIPGQHLDLIGAYRPDMREVDDLALCRSTKFVDSYNTTLDHIGELKIPLKNNVISRADILADFYGLGNFIRRSNDEITFFKNGGGAHLDLIVAKYILTAWEKNKYPKS